MARSTLPSGSPWRIRLKNGKWIFEFLDRSEPDQEANAMHVLLWNILEELRRDSSG